MEDYLTELATKARKSTVITTRHRLTAILQLSTSDRLLRSITPKVAARLYAERVAKGGRAATHRGELGCASRFGAHCAARGWLPANPFEAIEPVGVVSTGKPQLRVNEARQFARTVAGEDSREATAVLMALLMGLRAHEVVERVVRDVDDGGRLLWITSSKTRAGVRQVAIPEVLRARLLKLIEGRAPTERLFVNMTRYSLYHHVKRFVRAAGVPDVGPHGLRGTFATLAVTGELTGLAQPAVGARALAPQFGHEDDGETMRRHYLAPGAEQTANVRQIESVIGPLVTDDGLN